MRDLLFDVPWWILALIAIVGTALLVSGNRRQQTGLRRAGMIALLIAVGWAVMSYCVDTPKETCRKQTRRFVQSVVNRDWNVFDGLMAPGVDFRYAGSPWHIDGREALSSAVKADVDQIGLKSAAITDIKASETGATIEVTIKVWSNQDFTLDRPIDSEWAMDWVQSDGQWRLHEIRALHVSGLDPEQVRGSLRKH